MAANQLPPAALKPGAEDESYNMALQQLMSTLESRQNKGYNPTLLAIAEGMFAPTATGSFGESIGQAAKSVRGAQAQQEKEQMDTAQMRLQLAQAQREQSQAIAAQKAFASLVPSQGAAGQAAGQATGQPTGQTQDMKTVSLDDALKYIAAHPNQKELGSRLMEAAKAGLDRYAMSMNGIVFDKFAGKYLNVDIPGQKQEAYDTAYGKFNMTPNEYARFDMAQKIGMGEEWMNAFKKGSHFNVDQIVAQKLEGKQTAAPVATLPITTEEKPPSKAPGRLTVPEQEAEAAGLKVEAEGLKKSSVERTNSVLDTAKVARGLVKSYDRAQEIIKTPGIDKVMGLVNQGDVLAGIANLAGEAFRAGQVTVGIPAIKKVLTDSGVPQNVLNKALELGQLEAMWQMEMRKGLGAGTSISNMEQMMANRMVPSQDDPIDAYKQKLAFLQEKAKFDIELGRELKRRNLSYDKFEDTNEFDRMFTTYQNRLINIVSPQSAPKSAPKGAAPSTGPITSGFLRERLGIK